jgi:O-antigen/teichoic acid export membrane protein
MWRGAVVRAAWTAAARGAGFAATVVIARSLLPAEAGLFFFAMAAAGFLGPVMALGLPPAVARLAAGSDPGGRAAAVLRKALATELGVGAAAVAALLGAWLAGLYAPAVPVAIMGLSVALYGIVVGYLQGTSRPLLAEALSAGAQIAFLVLLLLLSPRSGSATLWWRVALEAAVAITALSLVLRRRPANRVGPPPRLRPIALPLWTGVIAWTILHQADVLTLGVASGRAAVAVYAPILKLAELAAVPAGLLGPYVLPTVAALHRVRDLDGIREVFAAASKACFVASLPVVSLLLLAPAGMVHLLFGIDAPAVPTIARWLAVGFALNAAFGLNGIVLDGIGQPRLLMFRSLGVGALGLLAYLALVPAFGAVGAAAGTCGALLAANLLNSFGLRRSGLASLPDGMLLIVLCAAALLVIVGAAGVAHRGPVDAVAAALLVTLATGVLAWSTTAPASRRAMLRGLLLRRG